MGRQLTPQQQALILRLRYLDDSEQDEIFNWLRLIDFRIRWSTMPKYAHGKRHEFKKGLKAILARAHWTRRDLREKFRRCPDDQDQGRAD